MCSLLLDIRKIRGKGLRKHFATDTLGVILGLYKD